LFGAILVIY